MIQLGGAWFQPQPAGGVRFDNYPSDTRFPELITEKVLLGNVASVSDVESTTFPSNITLRLTDGGVPFFAGRGDLRTAGADVPDFGAQLAQTLQGCEPIDGVCALDLVAHSDTFGTIAADVTRIAYRVSVNSLGDLPFDARTVLLPADGGAVFDVPLAGGLTIPPDRPVVAGVNMSLVALGLGPAFAPQLGRRGAVVSAAFQVAQPVTIDQPLSVTRLHLYVQRRGPDASLTVELRADTDGEPRGALLASATPTPSALPDDDFDWLAATFDRSVVLPTGARIWIVLRADRGEVEWRGDEIPGDGGGPVQPRPRQYLAGPSAFSELRIRAFARIRVDDRPHGRRRDAHTGVRSGCDSAHPGRLDASGPRAQQCHRRGRQHPGDCSTRACGKCRAAADHAHTLRRDVRAGRCSRRLKVRSSWSCRPT